MASGTAKRLGKAAARGTKVVKAKPVQKTLPFLSMARPLISGTDRTVASFTRSELVVGTENLARNALDTFHVNFAGGATQADHVMLALGVPDPVQALTDSVAALVDESARLDPTAPMKALLGNDVLGSSNPIMLSAQERIQRLLEGVVTIVGQARINGIDPDDLFRPPLLTATVKYVRSHIVRNGWDHGNWSELIRTAVLARLPLVLPAVHQAQLPTLKPPFSLSFGYDTVLRRLDLVVGYQNKAVRFARVAMGGSLTPHFIGNRIDSVHGAEILSQKVSDGIRNRNWNHQMPGLTIPRPYPNTIPANTAGWDPVSAVSIWGIDTPYLVESAYEIASNALWRAKGKVAISDLDLPSPLKTQLRAIMGGPDLVWDMPRREFVRLATEWLDRAIPTWEEALNTKLRTAKVKGWIKHPDGPTEVRVHATHQEGRLNAILAELRLI